MIKTSHRLCWSSQEAEVTFSELGIVSPYPRIVTRFCTIQVDEWRFQTLRWGWEWWDFNPCSLGINSVWLVPYKSAPGGVHKGFSWPCYPHNRSFGPLARIRHAFHTPLHDSLWRKEDLDDLWVFFILSYLGLISWLLHRIPQRQN